MVNLNSLIDIFFVRKQWLTTRKLLYRQAVFTPKKEFYRKQIKMHRMYFQALQVVIFLFAIAAGICYFMINYKSFHDDDCNSTDLEDCKGIKSLNWILTAYLLITIAKNVSMSFILYISLFKFYNGLVSINLKFSVKKCILAIHIVAFGLPIVSGMIYIAFIFRFSQVAFFTSQKAT